MSHELVEAFGAAGLALCRTLREMLDEAPAHRTERRGCGLTQATRFLAGYVNHPRDPRDGADLSIFAGWSQHAVGAIAACCLAGGWKAGWRALETAPGRVVDAITDMPGADDLLALRSRLDVIEAQPLREESRLLLAMIADILADRASPFPVLPAMACKPPIGSCSQAEEFFLEIAHGKIRRGGRVNILVDAAQQPVLVEKMELGESHSAVFVRPAVICGVTIPPGSLAALDYHGDARPLRRHDRGDVLPLSALAAVRFLRLTTLAVSPKNRERAFSTQFRRQLQDNMMSPRTTTLRDLAAFATARTEAA